MATSSVTVVSGSTVFLGDLSRKSLHDTTLQDIMIRYKRMDGYDALWLPGMDHAAIATEAKVVARDVYKRQNLFRLCL